MPMPTGGAWPPPAVQPVQNKITTWSAWYCGDPDQLAAVYGGTAGSDPGGTGFFASERGGWRAAVGSRLHRWFWGTPTPRTEKSSKLHVPIASDIASTSADLLFSEPPTLTVDDVPTQERLDELVDDGVHATLLEAAEICAALGGVYLRAVWDKELADRPWLSPVHPDAAIPVWRWGRLAEVTFWRVIADDGRTVLRHLEHHEPRFIRHALYEGSQDELGRIVPLTEHADTAGLAEVLVDGDQVPTGIDQLTAVYVPNMRPNRIWRSVPSAAALGRSDYAGVEPLMDSLDKVYTSWMRDIHLAKARLIVPSTYLQSQGPGQGAVFELDREVYESINMLGGEDRMEITAQQFAIRVDEHERTAQHLMTRIVGSAGYSGQTFGLTGEAAVTATEIVARERKSMITRDRKGRYWKPALAEILEVLLAIDQAQFSTGVTPERPDVQFGDSVSEDPQSVANTVEILNRAAAVSTETKVRMVHPDWDDTQVAEEIERIKGDTGAAVEDPGTFTGGPPAAEEAQPDDEPAPEQAEQEPPPFGK